MTRSMTCIGVDGTQPPPFRRVTDALNREFADRGLLPGDLDGMDMSFDVCLLDAVASLGGEVHMAYPEYYVALDGAPLAQIVPKEQPTA